MSLFSIIKELRLEQLELVAEILDIKKPNDYQSFTESSKKNHLKRKTKARLKDFYNSREGGMTRESYKILALWRDYILEILTKKAVKPENQSRKEEVIKDIKSLNSKHRLNDSDLMITVTRDILLLLWEESSEQQKSKFVDAVRKDLEGQHHRKFTEEEINNSIYYLLFGSIGGAIPFAVPLVAGVMLQQLTRGFMAWFLVNVMGQKAIQAAVLGTLAGPIGWGIAIGTGGLSIALSLIKLSSEQEKLRFIQAILSIYAFRYQNKLNQR